MNCCSNPCFQLSRVPELVRRGRKIFHTLGMSLPLAMLVASLTVAPALADTPLAKPSGRVILTISGAIDHTNADGRAEIDRKMLRQLGTIAFATSTTWTDGTPEFEGVLARDILKAVGAHGTTASMPAIVEVVTNLRNELQALAAGAGEAAPPGEEISE